MVAPTIEGKRALVTGGSRGLGAEIAIQLAAKGVKVAVNYASSKDRAEQVLSQLHGDGHIIVQGDVFSRETSKAVVDEAISKLGGLDILVSNAGYTKFGSWDNIDSVEDEEWIKCYTANVMQHKWLMSAAQDELAKNKGSFVISASVAGLNPIGSSMAYSTSKAGCIHLTKIMAKVCAPNIRVNAVAPGLMLTEWADGFSQEQIKASEKAALLGHISPVEDVAMAYIGLIENRSVTGIIVEVSAGFRGI